MPDKKITCKDCGKEFLFTEGEQEFYKERGLQNEPGRCKECRQEKKQQRNSHSGNRTSGGYGNRDSRRF